MGSRSGDDPQDVLVRTAHDLRRTVAGQSRFPVRNVDEEPDTVPRDVAYDLALKPMVLEPRTRGHSLPVVCHGRTAETSLRGTNRRLGAVTCAVLPVMPRVYVLHMLLELFPRGEGEVAPRPTTPRDIQRLRGLQLQPAVRAERFDAHLASMRLRAYEAHTITPHRPPQAQNRTRAPGQFPGLPVVLGLVDVPPSSPLNHVASRTLTD